MSSRLRFDPLCLRFGSSWKLGEYLFSNFVPLIEVACITPTDSKIIRRTTNMWGEKERNKGKWIKDSWQSYSLRGKFHHNNMTVVCTKIINWFLRIHVNMQYLNEKFNEWNFALTFIFWNEHLDVRRNVLIKI